MVKNAIYYKATPKNFNSNRTKSIGIVCYYHGKRVHIAKNCFKRKLNTKRL